MFFCPSWAVAPTTTFEWLPTRVCVEDVTGLLATEYASPSAEKSPWVSPAITDDLGLWLRDAITCMGPWAGLVLGGACALVLLGMLYGLWLYRRRRRSAKVRRHVTLMQVG
ncbi:hypothetical protein BIW11_13205 [Tropilaelaps mercedesae]|uniref:Uncharacterized protein n=1 Tax=Tropilaelaps mercedesae TaxID=418985 RepID=A0A1V9X314_9ACAR|nr:hypothetical protein BIW11_13205 [Tropilaelaps mercedesae]